MRIVATMILVMMILGLIAFARGLVHFRGPQNEGSASGLAVQIVA